MQNKTKRAEDRKRKKKKRKTDGTGRRQEEGDQDGKDRRVERKSLLPWLGPLTQTLPAMDTEIAEGLDRITVNTTLTLTVVATVVVFTAGFVIVVVDIVGLSGVSPEPL